MKLRRLGILLNLLGIIGCVIAALTGWGDVPRLVWVLLAAVCVNLLMLLGADERAADE